LTKRAAERRHILRNTSAAEARLVAERIVDAICAMEFCWGSVIFRVGARIALPRSAMPNQIALSYFIAPTWHVTQPRVPAGAASIRWRR
jgi:hypothetical protein